MHGYLCYKCFAKQFRPTPIMFRPVGSQLKYKSNHIGSHLWENIFARLWLLIANIVGLHNHNNLNVLEAKFFASHMNSVYLVCFRQMFGVLLRRMMSLPREKGIILLPRHQQLFHSGRLPPVSFQS